MGVQYGQARLYLCRIYIYTKVWRATSGRADTPAGGGQAGAMLRMGMHAYAMGEGRMRGEPQRGGRED
jgi:hypothetical protein